MPALSQLAFDVLARDKASATLDKVGTKVDQTGKKIESSSGRASKAFGLLGKTFADSSAGALGPLKELTDKFEIFQQATEQGGGKLGSRLLGVGLAATAAGSFLESLHSREQAALQQLQTSISETGHSYDDYAEEVEKAIKSGERFGNQASTTMDALNRLTVTTHNPEEAFKGLQVAIDVAAVKHVPLAKAAEQVGLVFNGSTRAGKQFGLKLEDISKAAQDLTAAQHANVSASTAAKDAQTSYTEKLDLWNNSATHTRAQAYALRDAHTRLVEAQDKAKAASDRLKEAQDKANDATEAGARNVDKLGKVVAGQGAAAADTFTGHLKQLGAQIEDTLGANGKLGGTVLTFGVVASGLGALAQTFLALRTAQVTAAAEGAEATVASAATIDAALASESAAAEGASTAIVASAGRSRLATLGTSAGLVGVSVAVAKLGDSLAGLAESDGKARAGILGHLEEYAGKAEHFAISMTAAGKALEIFKGFFGGGGKGGSDPLGLAADNANAIALARQLSDAQSDNPLVAARAQGLSTGGVFTTVTKAAAKAGKDSGDTYLKNLLDQISSQQAADAARKAAEDQAQAVIDAISSKFQAAQSRLQGLVSASLGLRQQVTSALQGGSALTDIFQGPDLNANGAFGKQNNFGRVRDFLQRRLAQERRFVLELRQLIKEGLDPSSVAQIAAAGVDGGQRIAEALLSGGRSGIGQVNSLDRQIASLANTTGKSVADQHYATQIAEQRRNTEIVGGELKAANARLAAIQKNTTPKASTDTSLVGVL